jgi:hypothetical protein
MIINQPNATYWDPGPRSRISTATAVSDDLLQRMRAFLAQESDIVAGGSDPAQPYEPNAAGRLLQALDRETDGEFAR